ncbi:MAG: prolyl oligopeptidase family serine peptidase, partial [Planctomycetota bacterium]|nr:prolyl oligopeptidase family serine peptidase [Planctomycetota bacterium]
SPFGRMWAIGVVWAILAAAWAPAGSRATQPQSPTSRPSGSPATKSFEIKEIELADGTARKYAIFTPLQYDQDPTHRWPVLVSLHGSPDCGTDGKRQTREALPKIIAGRRSSFPFITVMPQAKTLWFRGDDAEAVWRMLEAVHAAYRTDRDRVYLTGISMGGFATWELSMLRPDVFAAIVPVSGVGPTQYASNIAHLPIWAFHGSKDRNVAVAGSRDPIEALRKLGSDPKYTEYRNKPHKIWSLVYRPQTLWRWLLKQRRGPAPRVIDYKLMTTSATVWWLALRVDPNHDAGSESPPHIRAEIGTDGKITIRSEGVAFWSIESNREPLEPGTPIEVEWNGKVVFRGEFPGVISVQPAATEDADSKRGSPRTPTESR